MTGHLPALIVQHVPVGGPSGSPTGGGHGPLVSALLYVGVLVAGSAIARRRSWLIAPVVLAGVIAVATRGEAWQPLVLTAVHLVVVTVWIGAVVRLVSSTLSRRRIDLRETIVRLTPVAIASAAMTAATGTLLVLREPVSLQELLDSTFGALIALKVAALLLAAGLGLGHRRARSSAERMTFIRAESGALATALALGSALLATAAPVAAVTTAGRGVSIVSFASPASFFVRDVDGVGRLTLLSDQGVEVIDRASGAVVQLFPGGTADVTLTRGQASVTVINGRQERTVQLRAAHVAVPASPLLATSQARTAWALGRVLGLRQVPVPAARAVCLPDASALTSAERKLLGKRGRVGALVSGAPDDVARRLTVLSAGPTLPASLYLSPQLLDSSVMTAVANLRLPPVTVVGIGDPMSPVADRYRAALTLAGGGVRPSMAGLLGFESAVAPSNEGRAALFAAAPIGFLPGVVDEGHAHGDDDPWIPGGALVATTPVMPVRLDCTTEELS